MIATIPSVVTKRTHEEAWEHTRRSLAAYYAEQAAALEAMTQRERRNARRRAARAEAKHAADRQAAIQRAAERHTRGMWQGLTDERKRHHAEWQNAELAPCDIGHLPHGAIPETRDPAGHRIRPGDTQPLIDD